MRDSLKLAMLATSRKVHFKGKGRLLNRLGIGPSSPNLAPESISEIECIDGIVIGSSRTNDIMFRELLVNGLYQDDVLVALKELLKPGDVFWDIGANYGLMSIYVDKCFSGSVETIAFEPNPAVANELRSNLSRNRCRNVKVEELCLSDRAGTVSLHTWENESWGTTMCTPDEAHLKTSVMVEAESSTVDACLERLPAPSVIKMDVEGAEHLVLEGGKQFFARTTAPIVAEYAEQTIANAGLTNERYLDCYRRLGYEIYRMHRPFFGKHRWSSLSRVEKGTTLPHLCNMVLLKSDRP